MTVIESSFYLIIDVSRLRTRYDVQFEEVNRRGCLEQVRLFRIH